MPTLCELRWWLEPDTAVATADIAANAELLPYAPASGVWASEAEASNGEGGKPSAGAEDAWGKTKPSLTATSVAGTPGWGGESGEGNGECGHHLLQGQCALTASLFN
jgi:hypothetical protein